METATFVPKLPTKIDKASKTLRMLSQVSLLATLALVPLFILPMAGSLTLFPKTYLVVFGALISLLFVSLMTLRNGAVSLRITPLLLTWWGIVATGLLSAVLAPNVGTALFGDVLEIHTVGFLALMGLVMSLLPVVGNSKKFTLYLYGSFVVSAIIASLLFLSRILFGANFLSFSILGTLTDNFVGSFNDLGIFLGCIVMVSLVTLAQLDLPKKGLMCISGLLFLAFVVLASVNFFIIWLLLALFSLVLLMYVLTKDRFGQSADSHVHHNLPIASVVLIGLVFFVSAIFLIGGSALGTTLAKVTGVSYIEIRPSVSATIDILRPVYADNAFTGIGPNRFSEAWNLYKDQSINNTVFWNTPFLAGSGYIPTWFVTTGLVGVVAWLLFLGTFVYAGFRTLLFNRAEDSFWFFMGTTSFVAGLFIWILATVYVPGPTILFLGAICTGGLIVAQQKLMPKSERTLNLLSNSKTGFVLIAAVMICIIIVLSVGYSATRQFSAAYTFVTASKGVSANDPNAVMIVSARIAKAYSLYPTDTYARSLARYQLSYLDKLLALPTPTEAEQQEFQNAISSSLNASTQAIARKSTDARNWQVLADIYAGLSILNIEGSKERAFESYHEAEIRDPKNPTYVLQKSAMEARGGNADESRRLAILALELKPNYTDALYLLSQLDIAAGDIPTAITMIESLISIEANNPGRYYQLGVLNGAINNTDRAIESFQVAITLDPNYANARYFLAQQYLIKNDKDRAIAELEIVRGLSPDNSTVTELIDKIKSGELTGASISNQQTIQEGNPVTTSDGVTTTDTVPDSELLTPVNTGANSQTEEETQ